jgi:hypothetical protein
MARYQLTRSVSGNDADGIHRHLAAGTTIADTVGNAQAGDVVFPSVLVAPLDKTKFIPLDLAASTALGVPVGHNSWGRISGADSIQP